MLSHQATFTLAARRLSTLTDKPACRPRPLNPETP